VLFRSQQLSSGRSERLRSSQQPTRNAHRRTWKQPVRCLNRQRGSDLVDNCLFFFFFLITKLNKKSDCHNALSSCEFLPGTYHGSIHDPKYMSNVENIMTCMGDLCVQARTNCILLQQQSSTILWSFPNYFRMPEERGDVSSAVDIYQFTASSSSTLFENHFP